MHKKIPETIKTIQERSCCRTYNPNKEVDNKLLKIILEAGQNAPSAKNRQPYFFLVIKNSLCKKQIAEAAEKGRGKQFAHLTKEDYEKTSKGGTGSNDISIAEASAAILVLRNSDISYKEAASQSKNFNIKEEQGVATAAYSMMLAAKSLGLASGWICSPLYIKDELRKIVENYGIVWDQNWQPRVVVTIGYPLAEPKKPARKKINEISKIIE